MKRWGYGTTAEICNGDMFHTACAISDDCAREMKMGGTVVW
jgi:hypothetical protein